MQKQFPRDLKYWYKVDRLYHILQSLQENPCKVKDLDFPVRDEEYRPSITTLEKDARILYSMDYVELKMNGQKDENIELVLKKDIPDFEEFVKHYIRWKVVVNG